MKMKKLNAQESVIKRRLILKDYKHCLKGTELENKINQSEKSKINENIL